MNPQTYDWAMLQHAAAYLSVQKLLRSQAITSLVMNVLPLGIGLGVSHSQTSFSFVLALAIILVLVCIGSFFSKDLRLLLSHATLLVIFALWGGFVILGKLSNKSKMLFIMFIVLQIIWAITLVKKYLALRDTDMRNQPPVEVLDWLKHTAQQMRLVSLKKPVNTMYWQASNRAMWVVKLEPEMAIAVDRRGNEIWLSPRDQIQVRKVKNQLFNASMECVFANRKMLKVLMKQQDLEQFQAWRWAGIQQDQRGLWVPPAA